MGFKEQAKNLLDEKNYDELLKLSEEEIKNNPGNTEGYRYKSVCLYILENYDGAIECCDKILEINPKDFETHKEKAQTIFHKNENIKEVINYLDGVISEYPDEKESYITKASVLSYINIFKKVDKEIIKHACLKAIELDPDNIEPYNILGDIYAETNSREAEKYYQKALEIDDNDYSTNYSLANCISETEGIKEAMEYCDKLIEKNPDNIDFYEIKFNLIAFYSDFKASKNTKKMLKETILELFNKLVELKPDECDYYSSLGSFYTDFMEDEESAINIYNEAINKFPNERKSLEEEMKYAQEIKKIKTEDSKNPPVLENERRFRLIFFIFVIITIIMGIIAIFAK